MSNAKKQRKTIEKGKTRDLSKKIGDIKRTFCVRMGTEWFGPNKAEEIKTRWQEDREEL